MWLPSFTPADHARYSSRWGRVRLNLVQITWYGLDHRYIIDLIESEPDRYVGTGIVPAVSDVSLGQPDRTMVDLARCGIRAFRIRGRSAQGQWGQAERWLDQPGYERMFAAGAEHDLALSFLAGPADLPELDRMCERYPETPVVEAYGASRCMWESDSGGPILMEDKERDFGASVDLIRNAGFLTDDEKDQILGGTATELFFPQL
jgi:predicted TIM-barrel fold metal-dependent hydrolase